MENISQIAIKYFTHIILYKKKIREETSANT